MDHYSEILTALSDQLAPDRIRCNEPLAPYTTFRIGGPADIALFPHTPEELVQILTLCPGAVVLGAGSNVLISDRGIRGPVVILGQKLTGITQDGDTLCALAGTSLPALSQAALAASLTGLEFASGIPGSVGGAVTMNAGAYGGEISQVLLDCRVYENGAVHSYSNSDMAYGYRASRILSGSGIVLSARFRLRPDDRETIEKTMRELSQRRREKQPLSRPSAGSFFKRPTGYFAGKLIEDAGLKGYTIGGAQVSEKHAGFIINTGSATCGDVLALMKHVIDTVYSLYHVTLENEVRILGEF